MTGPYPSDAIRDLEEHFRMRGARHDAPTFIGTALERAVSIMREEPEHVVTRFAEIVAGYRPGFSLGLTFLDGDDPIRSRLRWAAGAGPMQPHAGGAVAREQSPSGLCLDCGEPILVPEPARLFPCLAALALPLHEWLAVPLADGDGRPAGTAWAVAHAAGEPFELSDLEILKSLGRLAVLALERASERRALRRMRDELDAIFGQPLVGIARTDADGRFIAANPRYCQITGRSIADLLGTPSRDLIHPDDREAHAGLRHRLLANGGSAFEEKRYLRPDGSAVWVSTAIVAGGPAREGGAHLFGVVADISDQKRTELELRRLAAIVENSSEFIGISDIDGRVTYVNDAGLRLVGLEGPEAARESRVSDYVQPEHHRLLETEIWPAIMDRGRWVGELSFRHFRTGKAIPVYSDIFRFDDPATGRPTSIATVTRDITERKRHLAAMEEALIQAQAGNRAKTEFLANVSHELRTPLNAILGFADMLATGLAGALNSAQGEYLSIIRQSGRLLLGIINDTIDLSRIEIGRLELTRAPVDAAALISESLAILRPRVEASGVQVSVSVPPDAAALAADPVRLKQIFLNLLSNAVKFTGRGGRVSVTAARLDPDRVQFLVADTGIGMTEREIELALQPFGHADTYTRSERGAGLGLPLARRLAELHGGSLSIRSRKGAGTAVAVTLPVGLER